MRALPREVMMESRMLVAGLLSSRKSKGKKQQICSGKVALGTYAAGVQVPT